MQGLCWGEGPGMDCWGNSVSWGDRKAAPPLFSRSICPVSVLSWGGLNRLAGILFYFICRKLAWWGTWHWGHWQNCSSSCKWALGWPQWVLGVQSPLLSPSPPSGLPLTLLHSSSSLVPREMNTMPGLHLQDIRSLLSKTSKYYVYMFLL